jgi:hypothetical protein
MSKNLNISVLVAARDEYIEQLKCIVVPLLIQGFNSIYSDALRISNGKHTIMKFQELLKEIPHWNQTILQEESKRIKRKCQYIMDIVTAIFVSNVKILASVRLKGNSENIRVKIPTSDIFIHSIYIEAAQQIFYDPFLFYHKSNLGKTQESKEHVRRVIRYSVDETIRQMLPFDDILQEYLANALNDEADRSEESDDSEPSSDSDSENELNGNDLIESEESEPEDSEPDETVKNFNLDKRGEPQPFPTQAPIPPFTQTPIQPFTQAPIQPFQTSIPQQIKTFDQIPTNELKQSVPQFINNPDPDQDSDSGSDSGSDSSFSSGSSYESERKHRHRDRDRGERPVPPPVAHREEPRGGGEQGYSYF